LTTVASRRKSCDILAMTEAAASRGDGPGVQVPEALLAAVVRSFDLVQVILFGSRARREAGAGSDWDLLVVLDDDAPPDRRTLRAGYEARAGFPLAADVVPVRRSRFEARAKLPGTLSHAAAQEGIVVYEREPGRGPYSLATAGSSPHPFPPPPSAGEGIGTRAASEK
jgi:predicted nucleotidyltransferase